MKESLRTKINCLDDLQNANEYSLEALLSIKSELLRQLYILDPLLVSKEEVELIRSFELNEGFDNLKLSNPCKAIELLNQLLSSKSEQEEDFEIIGLESPEFTSLGISL